MKNKPEDFEVYHHAIPKQESDASYTTVQVLPEIYGVPWNEITMCFVLSLQPSAIKVSTGQLTSDYFNNRITILINNSTDKIIQSIQKEVCIPTPFNYSGYDLKLALDKLKKEK